MKERPILFSGPMVRGLLLDTKTQTRRVAKFTERDREKLARGEPLLSPYGVVGDRLWVRETLREMPDGWSYDADRKPIVFEPGDARASWSIAWAHHKESDVCVSIHMPRWASRITRVITEVRLERLNMCSEEDAAAEGLARVTKDGSLYKYGIADRDGLPGTDGDGWPWSEWCVSARDAYRKLWDQINGERPGCSWTDDPWVWVVSFKRVAP